MERREPFISRVRLRNYRSIASCDVRLGPLTILIGPNGSGKSNFLDALAFLSRSLKTTPGQAVDERGGVDAILRSVPAPADSFSINVEVSLPSDAGWTRAVYGFTLERGAGNSELPFRILSETCSLGQKEGFDVNRGVVRNPWRDMPMAGVVIEPDRLYLQLAGATRAYAGLSRNIQEMHFYNLSDQTLRQAEPTSLGGTLGSHGERLANVLASMGKIYKERLTAYLRAIVPGVVGVDLKATGAFLALELITSIGNGRDFHFDPSGMSDGTVRAIGVLAALFQRAVVDGAVPLVAIEEPELALHPAATGVLFDALREASGWVQVIAASQSPDLLDREDLDVDIVRAVSMEAGLTTIGEVDEASRRIVHEKLYTLGELMRSNQIMPSSPDEPGSDPGE